MSSESFEFAEKRKRPHEKDENEECSNSKRFKESSISLLTLSDDVLIIIFTHLTTPDVLVLLKTCERLARVASDQSLWRHVDTTSNPLSICDFRKLLRFLHEKTSRIAIGGFLNQRIRMHHESVSPAILETICQRCPSLESLELKHCFIDAAKIKVNLLPPNLKHLGIVDCEMINTPTTESYFFNMHLMLQDLESIDLSNSPWLPTHSTQAMCKLSKLKKLCLKGCIRMGDTFVYSALATRFGFKTLEWLDVRDTCMGDSEIPMFSRLPSIKVLKMGHTTDKPFVPPQDSEGSGIITDRGVQSMCPMRGDPFPCQLEELVLTNTRISEKAVERILQTINLKILDIRGSRANIEKVEALLDLKPKCKVIFDKPNIECDA